MSIRILKYLFASLAIAACSGSEYPVRYEQDGGDPAIDYIIFRNDSQLTFRTPDNRDITVPYTLTGDTYTVNVAPMVTAALRRTSNSTLAGSVPFFEGTWTKR